MPSITFDIPTAAIQKTQLTPKADVIHYVPFYVGFKISQYCSSLVNSPFISTDTFQKNKGVITLFNLKQVVSNCKFENLVIYDKKTGQVFASTHAYYSMITINTAMDTVSLQTDLDSETYKKVIDVEVVLKQLSGASFVQNIKTIGCFESKSIKTVFNQTAENVTGLTWSAVYQALSIDLNQTDTGEVFEYPLSHILAWPTDIPTC